MVARRGGVRLVEQTVTDWDGMLKGWYTMPHIAVLLDFTRGVFAAMDDEGEVKAICTSPAAAYAARRLMSVRRR